MEQAPVDRQTLVALLRHAATCYGPDLALPCRPPGAGTPVAGTPVAVAPVAGAPGAGAPALAAAPATAAAPARSLRAPAPDPTADPAEALAALAAEVAPCQACRLHQGRTHLVFGEGSPRAPVMFIGEAPGQVEDETGRPFVGRSGQLLDRIIANAMGMKREDVFIANINKCRPPGNRDPQPDEIAACLPWLRRQVATIRPKVIVTLGRVALCNLLGIDLTMRRARGQTLSYEGTPVVPTWHPAYLLRNPAAKADTWEDIKRVNRLLGRPEVPPRHPD